MSVNSVSTAAESAVRDVPEQTTAAWGRHDVDGFAAMFSHDTNVVIAGSYLVGREAVRSYMSAAFSGPLKGTRVVSDPVHIANLAPGMALLVTAGGVVLPGETQVAPERAIRGSWLLADEGEGWRIRAYHSSPIPVAAPAAGRPIPVHEVPWEEVAPGLQSKPLWSDPATGRRAYVGRIAAGTALPLHRHLGEELVYVIEGDVSDESGTLTAGQASYRPEGCVHSLSSRRGTTVLIVVTGGMVPAETAEGQPSSLPIDISRIDWTDKAPGVREKVIWAAADGSRSMRMVRFEPGGAVPAHRHLGDALRFGIEGECTDESGTTLPGYLSASPAGSVHSVRSRRGGTMLSYTWGTTDPVDR